MRQNVYPRTPECSGIADRTSNQTYACNVKERAMKWNEQDDTERDGNRHSKSMQCEYAVHKYESGFNELMKVIWSIVAYGPGWCEWNSDKCFFLFLYVPGNRAWPVISPRQ
jgi:hypothetical protein